MLPKTRRSPDSIEKCPNCGSTHLIWNYERGEFICENCGFVIEDSMIDQGAEWRAFDNEQYESRARTGSPMTFSVYDKGLSTEISFNNIDSYGKRIPLRNRSQIYRIRKWNKRIKSTDSRNLVIALQELERISRDIEISKDIQETAAIIYRKAMANNMVRGRSIEALVAASIYAACRMFNIPKTLDEISKFTKVSKKNIAKAYRIENRFMKFGMAPQSPLIYLENFREKLNISLKTKEMAEEIIKKADEKGLVSGKDPVSIAISSLYIAAMLNNERKSQREFAEAAGITEVTLRNRYKDITKNLGLNIKV